MSRTAIPLLCALAATGLGCGGTAGPTAGGTPTPAQREARVELVRSSPGLNDLQLAQLCPALYPKDTLANPKRYRFEKQAKAFKPTSRQLALTAKARCGPPQLAPKASPAPRPS